MDKHMATTAGVFHGIHRRWRNIGLLQRLLIKCFVFLILPVLTVGILLFSTTLPLAQNEGRDSLVSMVNQLNENIQFRITGYQNILAQLSFDPRLAAALTQEYTNMSDTVDSLQSINSLMERVSTYFPMRRISIYQDNPTLPEDLGSVFKLERAYKEPWYEAMVNSPGQSFYWYVDVRTPGDPILHVSVWLKDYLEDKNYGLIKFEISSRTIFGQITNPLQDKHGEIMLLDQNRGVLSVSRNAEAGAIAEEKPYLETVDRNNNGWMFTKIDGKQSLVVYQTNKLGWRLIAIVSQEELWHKIRLIRNIAIIVSLLFVVLSIGVLTHFGINVTVRLKRLLKSIREVRNGNFGMQVHIGENDELAAVENEFNSMSKQLDLTVKDLADTRSWAEQEELRLLQAQINPHFLYNTLALVKYMAMDIGSEAISKVIDAMSRFFRLSLNRGKDVMTLKGELEHVQAYLEIHQIRYPNKVQIRYEIDSDILNYEIIKMTLQPIVENALTHAFVHTSGRGSLTIKTGRTDESLSLQVIDDGCGMTSEAIAELLNESNGSNERRGFGLRNVHDRLKKHYGEHYGLNITSIIESGTTVEVRIPMRG